MKLKIFTTALVLLLAAGGLATMPPSVQANYDTPLLPQDLDLFLFESEAAVNRQFGLVAGTDKRISWRNPQTRERTPLSIVYFHGFSATRQELAPVGLMIAERLGANLFETRLKGHGRKTLRLEGITAEDWLQDAAEALAVGAAIGERVVVFGTSTGATLALAVIDHPLMRHVDAMVLLSPNLVLQDRGSEILTWPGGPPVARIAVGDSRSWPARNELHGRYWTTTYPMQAVIETVRLMKFARNHLPDSVPQRILNVASPDDAVVNTAASRAYIADIEAPENRFLAFTDSRDAGQHVPAGDILSPETNQAVTDIVVSFLLEETGD